MIIREATTRDSKKIQHLQHGQRRAEGIPLTLEVKDPFFRSRRFKESIVLLAEDDQENLIIGTAACAFLKVLLKETTHSCAYLFDWSVSQTSRNKEDILHSLWEALQTHLLARDIEFLFTFAGAEATAPYTIIPDLEIQKEKTLLIFPQNQPFHGKSKKPLSLISPDINQELQRRYNTLKDRSLYPLTGKESFQPRFYKKHLHGRFEKGHSSASIYAGGHELQFSLQTLPSLGKRLLPRLRAPLSNQTAYPRAGKQNRAWFILDACLEHGQDALPLLERIRQEAIRESIPLLALDVDFWGRGNYLQKKAWFQKKYQLLVHSMNSRIHIEDPIHLDFLYL